MSKFTHAALMAAILAISTPALADHAGLGGGLNAAGPINVISAITAHPGHMSFGLNSEFVKARAFSDAQLIERAGEHVHAHSADYVLTTSASASYSITGDLMVSARIPYVYRDNIRSGAHSHTGGVTTNSVDNHGDVGGIGDMTLMGQYRFLKTDPSIGIQSSVLFGLKMPTGETGKKHDGEKLEAEHQPGSGSWDPTAGLAVTKQFGSYSLDASVLYSWATDGAQHTDLGDRASYGIAISKRIKGGGAHEDHEGHTHKKQSLDLVLELNGEWYGKEQEESAGDPNSGGQLMYLSPGLRYTMGRVSGQLSVGLPVVNSLRDGHSDTDYKITAGIGIAF